MGRGRRPTPDALKELAGNPGHRPLNDQAPKMPEGMPEMPKGMGHVANREWKWLGPALRDAGCLSKVDRTSFGEYCKAMAMSEIYYKIALATPVIYPPLVNKKGEPIRDDHGELILSEEPKTNPAFYAYAAASKLVKSLLIEFGLTPAARSKLKVDKKKEKDPLEAELAWMPPDSVDYIGDPKPRVQN